MKWTQIETFRALRSRNFRLFFVGQTISRIGMWMQRTAVIWVIYSITHSTFMIGLTIFAEQFPAFLLSLLGGIVSDRYSRYRIMFVTQGASMLQATLLAILILTGHYVVWEILTLSVMLGCINAFDVPARQPLIYEMLDDISDLPNALALNSSLTNLAKLIGPAVSGIVLETIGAGMCFLLNAVSFVPIIISLLMMNLPPFRPSPVKSRILSDLVDGLVYIKETPAIGIVLLMLTFISLLVLPYNTLLPVFAKEVFMGGADTYGYINAFIGFGAIIGTFVIASMHQGAGMRRVLMINTVVLGAGLIAFSQIGNFAVAMVFATVTGFGAMAQSTVSNILIQVESNDAMRGRVMSFLVMAFFGMMPLGALLVGAISHIIGAQTTLLAQGAIALLIAAAFSRPIGMHRGARPEMVPVE